MWPFVCAYNNSQTPKTNYMKKVYLALISLAIGGVSASAQYYVGENSYDSFTDAMAAVEAEGVVEVAGTVALPNARVGINKSFTLKGRGDDAVIQLNDGLATGTIAILMNDASKPSLTVENITFDGKGKERTAALIEAKNNAPKLYLKGVTIKNFKQNDKRLLDVVGGGVGEYTDLVIEDCEFVEGLYPIRIGNNMITVAGNCRIQKGINFEPGTVYHLNTGELTNTEAIKLNFSDAYSGKELVYGCNDPSKFESLVEGYSLVASGDNLKVEESATTGIEGVEADENAPAEYYNLQGVRVANPENGLYIVRQGNKVTKQIIR